MAEKFNFIKSRLDALSFTPELGKSKNYYHDEKINGLVLELTPKNLKTFQVYKKINSTPVRVKLGRYPDMTIDQARRIAQSKLSEMAEGINPNQVKKVEKARQITLKEVLADYLNAKNKLKNRTIDDYKSLVESGYLSDWKDKPLSAINREMVAAKHKKLGEKSHAGANLAMRVLHALFKFAIEEYLDGNEEPLFSDNPVKRLNHNDAWFDVGRRQTVLKEYELKPFFDAVMGLNADTGGEYWQAAKDYYRISLLTGMRLEEVLSLEWKNIDFKDRALISIKDTNKNLNLVIPLSDYLFDLLAERKRTAGNAVYVFASDKGKRGYMYEPKRQKKKIEQLSGVEFCAHDFRRTFETTANKLNISIYTQKRLLNHSQKTDVTAGYVIHDIDDLRAPMQRITDYILKAAGVKASAEIIPLERLKAV